MTPYEIRAELRVVTARKRELEEMLIAAVLPPTAPNACGRDWRPDGSCGYCGSMSVGQAIIRLQTPHTSYSGADWKYGWPHKFYIAGTYPHKFYNKHLADATREQFSEFNKLSEFYFGVTWFKDGNDIKYRATPDTQLHGKTIARKEAAS